jgi:hypothetical protein
MFWLHTVAWFVLQGQMVLSYLSDYHVHTVRVAEEVPGCRKSNLVKRRWHIIVWVWTKGPWSACIFDPCSTTNEMGLGTGLDLASVYGIIKAHGGFIDVTQIIPETASEPFMAAKSWWRLSRCGRKRNGL